MFRIMSLGVGVSVLCSVVYDICIGDCWGEYVWMYGCTIPSVICEQ